MRVVGDTRIRSMGLGSVSGCLSHDVVRRGETHMSVEDLDDVPLARADAHRGTSNALADIPITPPKGRGAAIEGIRHHGALLDGPAAQDGEATANGAAVVELGMGQDAAGGIADGAVVVLDPALLETDDVRRGLEAGDVTANLEEAR